MIDLRFVERETPDRLRYRKVNILQWRQCMNTLEVVNELQDVIWTEWEDVRIEEELSTDE